jgi:hypothetical protein
LRLSVITRKKRTGAIYIIGLNDAMDSYFKRVFRGIEMGRVIKGQMIEKKGKMRVHLLLLKRLGNKTRKVARPSSITRNIIITIIIERENAFGWSRQKSSRHKTIKQKKSAKMT